MTARQLLPSFSALLILTAAAPAAACDACYGGYVCVPAPPCKRAYVERTIYTPKFVTETRKVKVMKYRSEVRERKVTYYKQVAETRKRTCTITVHVPEKRTKIVHYSVCKPVWKEMTREYQVQVPVWKNVERTYTVLVPHTEVREATRTVGKCIAEEELQEVCRDEGHWEVYQKVVPCCRRLFCKHQSDCCFTTVCCRVWVPNIVTEKVPVTVYRWRQFEVLYQYQVTVCKPEQRTETVKDCEYKTETREETYKVCNYVTQQREREVAYTVYVPQQREKTYDVTVYKCVPVEKMQKYTVHVPAPVEREIHIRVCKMVPRKVLVPLCGCCPPIQADDFKASKLAAPAPKEADAAPAPPPAPLPVPPPPKKAAPPAKKKPKAKELPLPRVKNDRAPQIRKASFLR